MPNLKPTISSSRAECVCERCEKKFYIIPARKRQGKGRFCSRECFRVPRTERKCKVCDKAFNFHDRPSREGRGLYCSDKCKYLRNDPIDRFWAMVNKAPGQGPNGECWEWQGGTSHFFGYGGFNARSEKSMLAHRFSFKLEHGYLPEQVCHKCDNPPCVRPDHLFPGNAKINAEDRQQKGRGVRGERQHAAKLKEAQIPEIIKMADEGKTQVFIARKFNVSIHAVRCVISGETWAHLGLVKKARD